MKHIVVYKGKPEFLALDMFVSDEFGGTSIDPKEALWFNLEAAIEYARANPILDEYRGEACVARCEYRTTLHIDYL